MYVCNDTTEELFQVELQGENKVLINGFSQKTKVVVKTDDAWMNTYSNVKGIGYTTHSNWLMDKW